MSELLIIMVLLNIPNKCLAPSSMTMFSAISWWRSCVLLVVSVDGLAQDCSNSIANPLELLQSCTKPSLCILPLNPTGV